MKIIAIPMTLRVANNFVAEFHRHSSRTSRDGGKFAIGASTGDGLSGVAIVGRPIARLMDDGFTAEVLRTCTLESSPKGTCSFLYGACWRAWREMGGRRLITYTLQSESGSSLRGAGWKIVAECKPSSGWNREALGRMREWKSIYGQAKFRWEINDTAPCAGN